MKTIRTMLAAMFALVLVAVLFTGCDGFDMGGTKTGIVSLSLTDAPIADAADVEGVFITITEISYNTNGVWTDAEGFVGPQTFNLLELTNGNVTPLGNTVLPAGEVTQIRFMLAAAEEGSRHAGTQDEGTEGCYIVFDPDGIADGIDENDVTEPLFVPSGDQTGYKLTGSFDVPVNGTVEITADFDVRKSVVYAGNQARDNGFYRLKPTIRLIVNSQAGSIEGSFVEGTTTYANYIVFAYEDGTWDESEATAVDDQSAPFPNAVASANVHLPETDGTSGSYILPFLAAGTYDLVVAGVDADGVYTVITAIDYVDVVVESELPTTEDIDLATPTE